jgi:hypothetical protein
MFQSFRDVIEAIDELKGRRLILEYAIGGAMAQLFWDEAIPTFDVDVLVLMGAPGTPLVSLGPLYAWAKERGYEEKSEHIMIGGIPVQFLPAPDALSEEAIRHRQPIPGVARNVRLSCANPRQ